MGAVDQVVLRGRDRELTVLRRALGEARDGRGGGLVVLGEPGSGRTALLAAARAEAAGFGVREASGVAAERHLAHCGLLQLLPELTDLSAEPLALGRAVHAALTAAAPLLCLVDDADLLDPESRDALAFAARRLSGASVLVVFTAGTPLDGVPAVWLEPLGAEDSAQVLADHGVPEPVPDLLDLASGNPLALTELAAEGRIPPHSRLRRAVRERLAALDRGAREIALMAALDDWLDVDTLVRATERSGVDLRALEEARAAGFVRLDGDHVLTAGPLLQALIREEAPLADRRATHTLLLSVLDPDRHRLRCTWHRAALAGGADPRLAGELLESASEFWLAGRPRRARALLRQARPLARGTSVRGVADLLQGSLEMREGMPAVASQTLLVAANQLAGSQRDHALTALMLAGEASCLAGDYVRYYAIADRAQQLRRPDDSPRTRLILDHFAGMSGAFRGRHDRAAAPLRRVVGLGGVLDEPVAKIWASQAAYTLGDAARAHELAVGAVTSAGSRGTTAVVPWALVYVAVSELLLDRQSAALSSALEGLRMARAIGQPNSAVDHLTILALEASLRGDRETAQARLDAAGHEVATRGLGRPGALSTWASACVDLAEDRPEDALDRFRLMAAGTGRVHPGIRAMATPHFVEAAARCGQTVKAAKALAPYEDWARSTGSDVRMALSHRCRALLGEPDADEHFETAIELHRASQTALELAKTELFYAHRLRRNRKARAARELLRDALKIFQRYDAPRWAERTTAELRAAGESVPGCARPADLTPQQLQIARLVAEGATNREIAAQLVISHRTVDHHLRNIFARLGIRSRVELAARFR
ncbi:helix-turn-helix transcriptional regulator [Amycolatopsis thermoflava]|uniref:helix-turn-helix transcriptional regulator n=1 Tax=Amycolatopsis thermoflava TaxID=84480 RepID=UPI000F4C1029|nr:LuxR family transcriptional regulator [Amycolatopsis thermoflava]